MYAVRKAKVSVVDFYTEDQRELQDQFGTRRLADALDSAIIRRRVDDDHRAFIEASDFFFLSTLSADGWPTVSYKGGGRGFVRVLDETTLAFPSFDGNGMYLSMGNIRSTARIGMLFIDFQQPHRLRVQATATITTDDPLMMAYPGAELIVRARVEHVFVNCPRYIHPHERAGTSRYVPDAAGEAPVPGWKKIDFLQNSLRQDDQERVAAEGEIISQDEYGVNLRSGRI
jgi:predicted pyridoxine 5'-phosphate oxidase superfamily flavin-nucleotide-binding protein